MSNNQDPRSNKLTKEEQDRALRADNAADRTKDQKGEALINDGKVEGAKETQPKPEQGSKRTEDKPKN